MSLRSVKWKVTIIFFLSFVATSSWKRLFVLAMSSTEKVWIVGTLLSNNGCSPDPSFWLNLSLLNMKRSTAVQVFATTFRVCRYPPHFLAPSIEFAWCPLFFLSYSTVGTRSIDTNLLWPSGGNGACEALTVLALQESKKWFAKTCVQFTLIGYFAQSTLLRGSIFEAPGQLHISRVKLQYP